MTSTNVPIGDHRDRLLVALAAVRKARNPVMEKSILAALGGVEFDIREALPPLHPEIDELIFGDRISE